MARITDLPPELLKIVFQHLAHSGYVISLRPPWPDTLSMMIKHLQLDVDAGQERPILPSDVLQVASYMRAQLHNIQLVSSTWRDIIQTVRFPTLCMGIYRLSYGVSNTGFWYKTWVHSNNKKKWFKYLRVGREDLRRGEWAGESAWDVLSYESLL